MVWERSLWRQSSYIKYKLVVFGSDHPNQVTQALHQIEPALGGPVEQHPIQDVEQLSEQ